MTLEDRVVVFTVIATLPCGDLVISEVIGRGPEPTDAIRAFMDKGPFWTEASYAYEVGDGSGYFKGVVYNDSLIK